MSDSRETETSARQPTPVAGAFEYRITWVEEDAGWVGTCTRFPSLSHATDGGAFDALSGIRDLVMDVERDIAREQNERAASPDVDQPVGPLCTKTNVLVLDGRSHPGMVKSGKRYVSWANQDVGELVCLDGHWLDTNGFALSIAKPGPHARYAAGPEGVKAMTAAEDGRKPTSEWADEVVRWLSARTGVYVDDDGVEFHHGDGPQRGVSGATFVDALRSGYRGNHPTHRVVNGRATPTSEVTPAMGQAIADSWAGGDSDVNGRPVLLTPAQCRALNLPGPGVAQAWYRHGNRVGRAHADLQPDFIKTEHTILDLAVAADAQGAVYIHRSRDILTSVLPHGAADNVPISHIARQVVEILEDERRVSRARAATLRTIEAAIRTSR